MLINSKFSQIIYKYRAYSDMVSFSDKILRFV